MLARVTAFNSPGKRLRRIREGLSLKYRDVEEASVLIASRNKNPEFAIGLSRLADIENKGTVPSIYRMYSLATIYGFDYSSVLALYGVSLACMPADAVELRLGITKPISLDFVRDQTVDVPLKLLTSLDLKKTTYLSRLSRDWGRLPLQFLRKSELPQYRYVLVGTQDFSMYPVIPPGSFVQVDQSKRKVANSGWDNDFSRPIYFLELRQGYRFGWCTEKAGTMIVQPHSSSPNLAEAFSHPGEIEVIGQVVAVAMRLDQEKKRRKRSSSVPI